MAAGQLALSVFLAAEAERPSAGTVGIVVLVAIAALELAVLIAFSRIGRSDGPEGGDSDEGDDPGWGPSEPRTPPPDAPVCWPDFEREFAEYVAARAEQDRQAPAS